MWHACRKALRVDSRGRGLYSPAPCRLESACRLVAPGPVQRQPLQKCDGTQQRLQRQWDRLIGFFRRLKWPLLTHFSAFGKLYELPVCAQKAAVDLPEYNGQSVQQMEYMVGFFDGDGCVTTMNGSTSCRLSVCVAFDSGEIPILFHRAFGGAIYRAASGRGPAKPAISWVVTGRAAKLAAARLRELRSIKKPQLDIACFWPDQAIDQPAQAHALRLCKHRDLSESQLGCSWAYLAGFFDAEGYISVSATSASMRLEIAQKHPAILNVICRFLLDELPNFCNCVRVKGQYHILNITGKDAARIVLTRMLAAGLLLKRREAEIALTLSQASHMTVREQLSQLSGNQSRYKRLDSEGITRARSITRVTVKLWHNSRSGKLRPELKFELGELKQAHALGCLQARVRLLRKDIRALLREDNSDKRFNDAALKLMTEYISMEL
ncbi:unnamed protein product [Polarella glacialis]|uniref:Homing endonuclease LAGLIDADG domain-containing protein n=1 Tax=Polarella glacialis TaxID=89957 RepID=A0A813I9T2_POLGL|nr:unnamed protein product [Polarella glacialis]